MVLGGGGGFLEAKYPCNETGFTPNTVDLIANGSNILQILTKAGSSWNRSSHKNVLEVQSPQGYLARKKQPPPKGHHRAIGIGLM